MGMSTIGQLPGLISGAMPPGPGMDVGMGYRDLINPPQDTTAQLTPLPQQTAPQQTTPPNFQTSWEMAGYPSLEAWKAATGGTGAGQIGMGPAPLPTDGMSGGKGIGGMLPQVIAGQVPQLPGNAPMPMPMPTPMPGQGQLVGGPAGRPIMNPPTNRFAPPNAPGVRMQPRVSSLNQANPRAFQPRGMARGLFR